MRLLNKEIEVIIHEMISFINNEIAILEKDPQKNKKLISEAKTFLKNSTFKFDKTKSKKMFLNLDDYKSENNDLIKLYKKFSSNSSNKFFKDIKNKFTKLILNHITFCPYCGKNSMYYMVKPEDDIKRGKKIIRNFDFEHIFDKDTYNGLAVNFYNIIPSCIFCNQRVKGRKNIENFLKNGENKTIFHPYFGWLSYKNGKCYFDKKEFGNNIKFTGKEKFKQKGKLGHSEFFELDKIYFFSQDANKDIAFINKVENKVLADSRNTGLSKGKIKKTEKKDRAKELLKNFYPENESENLDFSNGKLRKDMVEDLLEII